MPESYTLRILVIDGDPNGVKIISRMNWTGLGIAFPRHKWEEVKKREELGRTGVYVLRGYDESEDSDDDRPTIYIGQGDTGSRINHHYSNKDFWDWAIVFVAERNDLNRAHVTWLEYGLIRRANEAGRCNLDNGALPSEPSLSEADKADIEAFLSEMLQILPLVNLHVFEKIEPVAKPALIEVSVSGNDLEESTDRDQDEDVVVVPARISNDEYKERFERTFFGRDGAEAGWHAIRISGGKLQQIKYLAIYQGQPESKITHYAPVDRIEPYGDSGKYRLVFSDPPTKIEKPIPFGNAPSGTMQGPRYTTLKKLMSADTLMALWD